MAEGSSRLATARGHQGGSGWHYLETGREKLVGASGTGGGGRDTEGLLFAGVPPVWPSVSSFMGPLLQSLKRTSSRRGNRGSERTAAFPRPQAGRRGPACLACFAPGWGLSLQLRVPRGWAGCWLGPQGAGVPGLHWVWGLWELLAGSACLSGSDPLWPRRCPSAESGDSCTPGGAGAWQGHSLSQRQVRADQELAGSRSGSGDGREAGFLAGAVGDT